MTEAVLPAAAAANTPAAERRQHSPATESAFSLTVSLAGLIVLVLLSAIIVMLAIGAAPAFGRFGLPFFWGFTWDSVGEVFSAGIMIYGTLVTALLALLIAVPLAIGCAYFLTELLPASLKQPIGTVIQLLAAIPSIIYGMWGFFVLAPWLAQHFILDVADFFAGVPVLGTIFDYGAGNSVFTAGLVLGVMILPLITALLALLLAVPLAIGCAYFLTELLPASLKQPIGTVIQLLAAIPSIIYGMWGFFVLAPWLAQHFILDVADIFVGVPVLGMIFDYGSGNSVFTAGLVLGVMILPLITAMFVEILGATPVVLKESVYGLGATRFEVIRHVAVPYGRRAMIGAVMLGLGRALGETMAVTFVIGNATRWSPSIFSQGSTIASTIANEFAEAGFGTMKLAALLALGLTLFIISFVVLAASRALVAPRVAS